MRSRSWENARCPGQWFFCAIYFHPRGRERCTFTSQNSTPKNEDYLDGHPNKATQTVKLASTNSPRKHALFLGGVGQPWEPSALPSEGFPLIDRPFGINGSFLRQIGASQSSTEMRKPCVSEPWIYLQDTLKVAISPCVQLMCHQFRDGSSYPRCFLPHRF